MSTLSLFEWFEATPLGQTIRHSLWLFPVLEAVHLLGLCALGGAVLLVDLRLLGVGLRQQSIAEVARGVRRWLVVSVSAMVVTGALLFLSEAIKCYHNPSFWVKITTLPIAVGYTFLVRQRIATRGTLETSFGSRMLAVGSLALWFTVAAAGRWIGFSS